MNNQKVENPELRLMYQELSHQHTALALQVADLRREILTNQGYLMALAKSQNLTVTFAKPETDPIQAGLEVYSGSLETIREIAQKSDTEDGPG
jgi:hypothetical protein